MFKQLIKIFFLFFVVIGGVLFLGLGKAKASPSQILINEIFKNPVGNDTGFEWIELYNKGNTVVDMTGFDLYVAGSYLHFPSFSLEGHNFVVVHINTSGTNSATDLYQGTGINMGNTSGSIALFNSSTHSSSTIIDFIEYGTGNLTWQSTAVSAGIWFTGTNNFIPVIINEGFSMSRIPNGCDTNTVTDWVNPTNPTFLKENNLISLPQKPNLLTPLNSEIITVGTDINFTYEEEINITCEVLISQTVDMSAAQNLDDIDSFSPGNYFWQVTAKNILGQETKSDIFSFQIIKPIYSNAIIINELMADPMGDETVGEWIELFNNSAVAVNLKGWILEDKNGSIHRYIISDDLWMSPFGYVMIYRNVSGITLNNDSDGVRLYQPDETLLFETPIFSNGDEGLAWARGPGDVWGWTDQPTVGVLNIIHLPDNSTVDSTDTNQTVNSEPIEISTGDFQNYENYLVTVMGEVTETAGDTFYLDDGTGRVKIYIQKKTGIDKPEMHKGDIFLITGVVNLYVTTWRILPRTVDDIKLVESKVTVTKNATKRKTVAVVGKTISAKNLVGQVKAASSENKSSTKNSSKTSFWTQFLKLMTSLSVIFLILLVVKVLRSPKSKIIGGHFGEDET